MYYSTLKQLREAFQEEQNNWDYRYLDLSVVVDKESVISQEASFLVLTSVCSEDSSARVYVKLFDEANFLSHVNAEIDDYKQQCIDQYGDDDGYEDTFNLSEIIENYMNNSLTISKVSAG